MENNHLFYIGKCLWKEHWFAVCSRRCLTSCAYFHPCSYLQSVQSLPFGDLELYAATRKTTQIHVLKQMVRKALVLFAFCLAGRCRARCNNQAPALGEVTLPLFILYWVICCMMHSVSHACCSVSQTAFPCPTRRCICRAKCSTRSGARWANRKSQMQTRWDSVCPLGRLLFTFELFHSRLQSFEFPPSLYHPAAPACLHTAVCHGLYLA